MKKKTALCIFGVAMVLVLLLGLLAGCHPGTTEQPAEEYPSGTLVFGTDGVARLYGQGNQITKTYKSWAYAKYKWGDLPPWHADQDAITAVVIEEGVDPDYTNYWFYEFSGLTSITIPASMTKLGSNMFAGCENLTSVILSDGLDKIGDHAFYGCENLTDVTIPGTVTIIGENAF